MVMDPVLLRFASEVAATDPALAYGITEYLTNPLPEPTLTASERVAFFQTPSQLVEELRLYLENTGELHGQFMSIIENLKKKMKSGHYDPALAPKLWRYWVETGVRMYGKENDVKEPLKLFPTHVRDALAKELAADYEQVIKSGEYGKLASKWAPKKAGSKLTKEQIAQRLFDGANRLFSDRVALRGDNDMLQDAYDDATGLVTKEMYADPLVKQTRDMVYQLDHQIGMVARQMEHLARELKKR